MFRFSMFPRFRVESDLASRVANGKTLEQQKNERSARFSLYEDVNDTIFPSKKDNFVKLFTGTFLDRLMSEIPG